jgi:hypothetical protein
MIKYSLFSLLLTLGGTLSAGVPFPQIVQEEASLTWQTHEAHTQYLLFGSEDPDFQLDADLLNDSRLQAVLEEPGLALDQPLPYYRIVAYHPDGILSDPSPIIAIKEASRLYPKFTNEQWEAIGAYLLPDIHPTKSALDKLFQSARVTASEETLKEAGFSVRGPGSGLTLVARHPKLSNVLVKLYTDDQNTDEFKNLYDRIKGAEVAKQIIKAHEYQWLFKVPRKWFYILPQTPAATGPYPKQLVLIVEDMQILPKDENYPKWKSSAMTKEKLDAIFIFLTEGGFNDLALAFNMPFSRDGRLAVVDTEDYHKWPIPYDRLIKYLSPKMQDYWNQLIAQGGPEGFHASKPLRYLMKLNSCQPPKLHSEEINP